MSVFVQRVMQGLLLVCAVIMLIWIVDVFLKSFGFSITIGIVLWGCAAYYGITRSHGRILVVFWIALIACFVEVFLTFLFSAQRYPPISHVPVWMQAMAPYVYALTPVIVLGGLIWIIPVYWRRK